MIQAIGFDSDELVSAQNAPRDEMGRVSLISDPTAVSSNKGAQSGAQATETPSGEVSATPERKAGRIYGELRGDKWVSVRDGVVIGETDTPAAAEKKEKVEEAVGTLSAWQNRRARRHAKKNGLISMIEVPTGEGEEKEQWFVTKLGLSALSGLQMLVDADEDSMRTRDGFSLVASGLFFACIVKGLDDPTPYFESIDEAKEFVDDPAFVDDAMALFMSLKDFLGVM